MAEKKGNTGPLYYDFDTSKILEVQLPSGNWYRVTPREFRSFNGPRKITYSYRGNDTSTIEDYDGPVYLFGTNTINKNPVAGYNFVDNTDPRISKPRQWEMLD
jgi:hypothetical protein